MLASVTTVCKMCWLFILANLFGWMQHDLCLWLELCRFIIGFVICTNLDSRPTNEKRKTYLDVSLYVKQCIVIGRAFTTMTLCSWKVKSDFYVQIFDSFLMYCRDNVHQIKSLKKYRSKSVRTFIMKMYLMLTAYL